MNQYPVIFLTFKNIDGLNFQRAYDQLVYEIGSLFEEHSYLTDCEQLSENERQMFRKLQNQQASEVEISRSLQLLLQIMNKYYGKQVILLLDEYDVPLAKASTNNYNEQMLEIIKTMMATALKDNSNLKFAIITGYLTKVRKEEFSQAASNNISTQLSALKIPNEEIKEIFETTIKKWFDDNSKTWDRQPLFKAVWNKDTETATKEMNKLLRKTISYHDYNEDFYHAFLAGIFAGAGYMVESNKEHGEGRSDVVVYDSAEGRVMIFEAKYSKTIDAMERDCQTAIKQIDERMYAKEYEDSCDEVICYGI